MKKREAHEFVMSENLRLNLGVSDVESLHALGNLGLKIKEREGSELLKKQFSFGESNGKGIEEAYHRTGTFRLPLAVAGEVSEECVGKRLKR